MRSNCRTLLATTVAVAAVTVGCSDYRGYLNHATSVGPSGIGNPDIWCAPSKGDHNDKDSEYKKNSKKKNKAECGEAKIWGSEVSVLVTNPDGTTDTDQSGTFAFTVAYDFRGYRPATLPAFPDINPAPTPAQTYPSAIDLTTYRNRVVGAFNSDGQVDRDGDDIRWNSGNFSFSHDPADPAGIWERRWLYRDKNFGCQFATNFKKAYADDRPRDKNGDPPDADGDVPDPAALVCNNTPSEEVDDQDESLQCGYRPASNRSNDPNPATPACRGRTGKDSDKDSDDDDAESFKSLDELFKAVWSGAVSGRVTLGLTGIDISSSANGVGTNKVTTLSSAAEMEVGVGSLRIGGILFDAQTTGGQALVKALLANTSDGVAFTPLLHFGDMTIPLPRSLQMVVNHAQLEGMLNQ